MGLQLAAIGWLITSENARAYLAMNKKIIRFLLLAVVFLFVAHIFMIIDTVTASERLAKAITENAFYTKFINNEETWFFRTYNVENSPSSLSVQQCSKVDKYQSNKLKALLYKLYKHKLLIVLHDRFGRPGNF
jgi:hypothetical protein